MKALLTNAPECTLKVNRMFSFEWIPLHFDFFYLMLRRLWTSYLSTWKLVRSFWQKQLTVKFRFSEKHTKIWKINPYGFDKSADLLSKRQNHEGDFFSNYVCFSKSPNFNDDIRSRWRIPEYHRHRWKEFRLDFVMMTYTRDF